MPAILRTLQRLVKLFDENKIDYMIIGGYALPFYGRIRTTVGLDLAVAVGSQFQFALLLELLRGADFEPTICSSLNSLLLVLDQKEKMELELWTKPDGIVFDRETLERRRKADLSQDVSVWLVSPEDFIVTKTSSIG